MGALITDAMGRQAPEGLLGVHINLLVTALSGTLPGNTPEELAALAALKELQSTGDGYLVEQSTRPRTIGYALLDSPVAPAAWMLDHDTDSYHKIARAFLGGSPSGGLTRPHPRQHHAVLADRHPRLGRPVLLGKPTRRGRPLSQLTLPVGFTTFPGEAFQAPRSWGEDSYSNVIYSHKVAKGGHFAACEEPELFATEVSRSVPAAPLGTRRRGVAALIAPSPPHQEVSQMATTLDSISAARPGRSVAGYATYDKAQQAVDHLSDNGFPVENADIVGSDLRLVEHITGRLTTGRAALAGAGTGAWFGLFFGLLVGLFTTGPTWLGLLLGGLLIGAAWGAIFGFFAQWATGGRRDFSSERGIVAGRYDVVVADQHADRARELLAQLP